MKSLEFDLLGYLGDVFPIVAPVFGILLAGGAFYVLFGFLGSVARTSDERVSDSPRADRGTSGARPDSSGTPDTQRPS